MSEAGCLYYDLYQSLEEPTKFFILDGRREQAAIDGHANSPNVAAVVEKLQPLLKGPVAITANLRVSEKR